MFTVLEESGRWTRRLGGAVPSSMMSLVVHGALVCGALAATMKGKEIVRAIAVDTIPIVLPQRVEPARRAAQPGLPRLERPPVGYQTVIPIVQIPTDIPPVDLTARWNPNDFSGSGRAGGIADGDPDGTGPVPVGLAQVFVQAVVDEPPVLLSGPPLQYPPLLRAAGIEGEVIIEVVIGPDGHQEAETLRVVHSTNHGFEQAARDAMVRCIFRPGRVRGAAVRVLIRQPIRFAIIR
jgi:protein TonB